MYNYDTSFLQTDPRSTVCLRRNSRTQTCPYSTIAPHQSSPYPEYLSPTWDKETQRAVVWTRLCEHRKLASQSLKRVNEQYRALRQEQQAQAEPRHEPSSCDTRLVEDFKTGLSKHVEVTDLGELHWMLGIEVKRDRAAGTIHLSQRAYIDSILNHFNFADLKLLSTRMDVQVKLSSEQAPASTAEFAAMRDVPYREAVGALNWAALATRPDILFTVLTVARFTSNPGPAHWDTVKRIFRYLAGSCNLWLSYGEP